MNWVEGSGKMGPVSSRARTPRGHKASMSVSPRRWPAQLEHAEREGKDSVKVG